MKIVNTTHPTHKYLVIFAYWILNVLPDNENIIKYI